MWYKRNIGLPDHMIFSVSGVSTSEDIDMLADETASPAEFFHFSS